MSLFFSSHCREIFKRKIETEIFRIVSLANNKNWKRKIAASFTRLSLILDEVSVKVFLFGKMENERARYACEKSREGIEVDRGMSSKMLLPFEKMLPWRERLSQAGCYVTKRCHGFVTRSRGHP